MRRKEICATCGGEVSGFAVSDAPKHLCFASGRPSGVMLNDGKWYHDIVDCRGRKIGRSGDYERNQELADVDLR